MAYGDAINFDVDSIATSGKTQEQIVEEMTDAKSAIENFLTGELSAIWTTTGGAESVNVFLEMLQTEGQQYINNVSEQAEKLVKIQPNAEAMENEGI